MVKILKITFQNRLNRGSISRPGAISQRMAPRKRASVIPGRMSPAQIWKLRTSHA